MLNAQNTETRHIARENSQSVKHVQQHGKKRGKQPKTNNIQQTTSFKNKDWEHVANTKPLYDLSSAQINFIRTMLYM